MGFQGVGHKRMTEHNTAMQISLEIIFQSKFGQMSSLVIGHI